MARILRRAALDVTVKSDWASAFPIRCVIRIDSWPRTHRAEEDVLNWIDHDTGVSTPNHQIPRLGMRHSLKFWASDIEIKGTHVGIRKSGPIVYCVYEMRT